MSQKINSINLIVQYVVENEIIFKMSNGGRIKVARNALQTIVSFIQKEDSLPESGGILLGRFIKDCKAIVVDKVTIPMKGDKQTRYSFRRLSPLHQQILDEEWEKSKGTCNYLGEWHTHPEENPEPSGVDKRDWNRKLRNDIFSSRYLYFIIAGTKYISMWEGDRRTLEIKKLEQVI